MRVQFKSAIVMVVVTGLVSGMIGVGCNRAAPAPVVNPQVAGVQSVNGKTGDVVLTVDDLVPPAPPTPPAPMPPPPVPPPAPKADTVGIVVVRSTLNGDQRYGALMSDPDVIKYVADHNLKVRILNADEQDPPADAAAYITAAKASTLPYLFVVGKAADGSAVKLGGTGPCPLDKAGFLTAVSGGAAPKGQPILTSVMVDGHARKLGNIIPKNRERPKWSKLFGASVQTKVFPRTDWVQTDLSAFLPPVKDQDGLGACNAFATSTSIAACRNQQGLGQLDLSAGFLYGNICQKDRFGRRLDSGSMLEDGLAFTTNTGICSTKLVPEMDWQSEYSPAAIADANQHVVIESYLCPTFDHCASAIQQGFFLVEGILWWDNFQPDGDGWLPTRGAGNYGGHALCGFGLAQRNGVWGIKTRNSWGKTWGLSGNCVVPETSFSGDIGGWWAVRAVKSTPVPDFPVLKP